MSSGSSSSSGPVYYLPITEPNLILEGCEILLKNLIEKIIEKHLNGYSNYSDETNVRRVNVLKLEIEFNDS